jgi:monoamine oxidase
MSRARILNRIYSAILHSTGQPYRFSRRELMKSAGLLLGVAALAPRLRASSTPSIAIVGAGIAGLTAALTLQDAGVPSVIFESSTRIGGRMHSEAGFWDEGQCSEWCGEFIDSDHFLLRSLAARFGLTLDNVNAADPPHSVDTNYIDGSYYTEAELHQDIQPLIPVLVEQNKQIGNNYLYNNANNAAIYFDHISADDWIEAYVPGGHGSRLGQYLDLGVVSLNGLDSRVQSGLNMIIPVDSNERFHTQGGNDQIPFAIANTLPKGAIKLGWKLAGLVANSDQTVTLRLSGPMGTTESTFDYVILALPFSVLRSLDLSQAGFDALKLTAIRTLGYGTNSKLELQFDQRFWNSAGAWPGISNGFITTDLPFQGGWDTTRGQPGADGIFTDYTGGTEGASYQPSGPYTTSLSSARTAAYAQSFLNQLEVVWPGATTYFNGRAILSYPTGDPNVLGSYSAYQVGQYTRFGGYEFTPQGRIYFAGEHTSVQYQGYMEGGAGTGRAAAIQLLNDSK